MYDYYNSSEHVEVQNVSIVFRDRRLDDWRQRRRLIALEADLRDPFMASQFAVRSLGKLALAQRHARHELDVRCVFVGRRELRFGLSTQAIVDQDVEQGSQRAGLRTS